jgi:glycosyltransferase involved in cell wall biosynthesis
MDPTIDILLATYNGDEYLADQIDSLLKQTRVNWHLIARDDGSTDATRSILADFKNRYPEKITLIEDGLGNLGACGNFAALLGHAGADYIMFCDQDDVWLPDKIDRTLRRMTDLAQRFGNSVPLLVYSDMKVVDRDARIIADSYWNYQAFNPETGKVLSRLLVSNVIIGCTVMINRTLRDMVVPLPPETLMHDWWAGLVSVALGKNDFIGEPTVLYRQHGSNVVGATWTMNLSGIISKLRDMKKHREFLLQSQRQAGTFADRYGQLLSTGDLEKIRTYAGMSSQNWMKRRYIVVKHGFWWSGLLRNVTLLLIV